MREWGQVGRLMLLGMCGVGTLGAVVPSSAAAQERSAAIAVHATVRDITEADVIGAHAVTSPPVPGNVRDADTWRITSGRSASVGIRVDGAEAVTICEERAGGLGACEPYRSPRLETTRNGTLPALVVRVGSDGRMGSDGASSAPVRLTLAFIDF